MRKEKRKLFMILFFVLSLAVVSCGRQKAEAKRNAEETATEFMQRLTEGDLKGAKALATEESGAVLAEMADAGQLPMGAEFTLESMSEGDSTARAMVVIAGEVQSLHLIEMPDGSWLVSYVAAAPVEIKAENSVALDEERPSNAASGAVQ